ncbi:hypothetical protein [Kitasatospora sp. DSM 101779]|uniref:hypothetical protein n=1 Tax=Kitasatospora sp. DSM 101779 TaxID=2853165 RepID=UPI0021DB7408|nr:hypothetical protein [Kitasatospora sp. DSM 101779]MCU7822375.1 hypothetical protein [Kitasatospora sp. DSM 101779]
MALREDTGPVRTAVRYGRHSRPKPIGGRFRLPTIRFSGAAVAMSTVVGISIATTWLLNEQQGVGRRPGMSNVGASPPLPSPDGHGTTSAAAVAETVHTAPTAPTRSTHTGSAPAAASGRPSAAPSGSGAPSAGAPSGSPSPSGSATTGATTGTSPSPQPTTPRPLAPEPARPGPATPTGRPTPDTPTGIEPLSGRTNVELIGPAGTRHTLLLEVREPMTALQVELRLLRPVVLPGTAPWTSLPGAVTTVSQEHGTLIHRYTLPGGLDIEPGTYAFEVLGTRLPGSGTPAGSAQETWSASAFVPYGRDPHAVAVRGVFEWPRGS